ncbi:MAG: SUMF1/EgtB/PvdO family nonheme iron enzyme [Lentisphaeria bacterium]|nr:SUMF1/EgtB/PvdO family nonheme iron enzyme [Lentisphaeria bacterium]
MKNILALFLLTSFCALGAETSSDKVSKHDGMRQILIPATEFIMGADDEDAHGRTAEFPPHKVRLDAYWIDEHEVTNAQYADFLNATRRGALARMYSCIDLANEAGGLVYDTETGEVKVRRGFATRPVCAVSLRGAADYARHVKRRLPTEAEWELAARGTDQRRYPWGNEWNRKHTVTGENHPKRPAPVGTTTGDVSPFGVRDMAGNVKEWVQDTWRTDFYLESPVENPVCTDPLRRGVLRGGAWCLTEWDCRATSRKRQVPGACRRYVGFRCAESVPVPLPTAAAVSDDVRFYAPLDGSVHAAAARGMRHAVEAHGEIQYVPGRRGQAALLGESDGKRFWIDYDTEDNLDMKQGTVALWVKPVGWKGSNPGFRFFFMIRDPALARFYLYRFISGGLMAIAGNGANGEWHTVTHDCSKWKQDEWQHLAITWTTTSLALYVNGTLIGQQTIAEKNRFRGRPAVFSIGQSQNWDGNAEIVRGQTAIDEVVVYGRALSAPEIQKDMTRKALP